MRKWWLTKKMRMNMGNMKIQVNINKMNVMIENCKQDNQQNKEM